MAVILGRKLSLEVVVDLVRKITRRRWEKMRETGKKAGKRTAVGSSDATACVGHQLL